MILNINIPLEAMPKQSARFAGMKIVNGKAVPIVLQSKKIKATQKAYAWYVKMCLPKKWIPTDKPIWIHSIQYNFKPVNDTAVVVNGKVYKITTPDLPDNMNKMLCDAMNKLVYRDDTQIIHMGKIEKVFSDSSSICVVLEVIEDYRIVKYKDGILPCS